MTTCEKRPGRYRLTTAEITYHLPDYPHILRSIVWQNLDLAPTFPARRRFLAFWQRNLMHRLIRSVHEDMKSTNVFKLLESVRMNRSLVSVP